MVYTYKNSLLIDRNDTITSSIEMAKRLGVWFSDENRVWHVKNPGDKIILIYKEPIRQDDTIKEYKNVSEIDFRLQTFFGYIQLYCNQANVKVGNCKFSTGDTTWCWKLLKQYLVQTIKNISPQLRQNVTFTLYWDSNICTQEMQNIANMVGLMSDKNKRTYVFTENDFLPDKTRMPSIFGNGALTNLNTYNSTFGSSLNNSFGANIGNSWASKPWGSI